MHGEESTTQEPQRADRDYDEPIIPGTSDGQWIKEPQFCTSIAARESASPGAALEVGAEYRPGPRHPESGGRNMIIKDKGMIGQVLTTIHRVTVT